MIEAKRLLADLQKQVRGLETDLRAQAEAGGEADARLRTWYAEAKAGRRTGLTYDTWRDQQFTQVAVGWVLACVFTRFCEDNGLLDQAMLAGPDDRLAEARERQGHYFRERPADSDLDYLRAAIARLERYDATRTLVDRHNPLHLAEMSPDAATGLLDFWRRIDPDTGVLSHDFRDEKLSTRFLGDLYQDLSEQARKDYALLQTPEFVEEFILDRTLDPAIDEYGLDGLRLIDPTCGSGHFLLGTFHRLLDRWREQEPGIDVRVHVERALGQVHGVDINPYASAIARFRLVIAALTACRITRLADAPTWRIRVAIGDSLRFGVRHGQETLEGFTEHVLAGSAGEGEFVYEYEDARELEDVLGQRYHAVVGNPPYITVKDPVLSNVYRSLWDACHRQYALSVPFAQRFFDLAVSGGFTGQITANSFMKREFGRKLIEKFFPTVDLTHVIDTSGAYIPGHNREGTPTVIVIGRNRAPVSSSVRAVLRVRGENGRPENSTNGNVWLALTGRVDRPGWSDYWITVVDLDRTILKSHPWSLAGDGAIELIQVIEKAGDRSVAEVIADIGFGAVTREDSAFVVGHGTLHRFQVSKDHRRPLVEGDVLRDWHMARPIIAAWPYNPITFHAESDPGLLRLLWPYRSHLNHRVAYGRSQIERGLAWFEYSMFFAKRYRTSMSIVYAFKVSHNHFVLDRGENVFKQTAPLINLMEGASEEDHLSLLGVLNSSTVCFWLRENTQHQGGGSAAHPWSWTYEFASSIVEKIPLAGSLTPKRSQELHILSRRLDERSAGAVCAVGVPTRQVLDRARAAYIETRQKMIAAQEELDWEVYDLYGLLGDDVDELIGHGVTKPPLALGERAFEIALARKVAAGEEKTEWFTRHGSTPITEPPAHWPADYRELVERRLRKIADDPYLHLIERPECKRRWAIRPWEDMEADALRGWLLDRLEARERWHRPEPTPRTVAQLADELRADADFVAVASLHARDTDLGDVVAGLVKDQHVPFLAAWRYTDTGLRVRAQWERTWDLQRREDAGEKAGEIDVPPKYEKGDFRDIAYWRNRGKLDVPKERFISYPDASRDGTLLLGWAGWDHLQQAQALTTYVTDRRESDVWDAGRLTPLLAGLGELLPWVGQWHPDVDPEFGVRPADAYTGFLDEQLLQLGLTRDDLTGWRPPARTKKKTTKPAKT
ncbi:BREX-2 system adenine-specific DNA-methyltransferase PglX [Frankia sp. Cas3]|uniref:BREX-2 system adenine-specific DNA-methyltransferase PglX n=1 Tax=Frankia sp. Cas3 TaxID=3073926 RepID=UPI002AD4CC89|nr:BREX-2 system adenine-specific DNA-methyltransferase PglX [Frankia sp. Cas3]